MSRDINKGRVALLIDDFDERARRETDFDPAEAAAFFVRKVRHEREAALDDVAAAIKVGDAFAVACAREARHRAEQRMQEWEAVLEHFRSLDWRRQQSVRNVNWHR